MAGKYETIKKAYINGDLDTIKQHLNPRNSNTVSQLDVLHFLHLACVYGHIDVVKFILYESNYDAILKTSRLRGIIESLCNGSTIRDKYKDLVKIILQYTEERSYVIHGYSVENSRNRKWFVSRVSDGTGNNHTASLLNYGIPYRLLPSFALGYVERRETRQKNVYNILISYTNLNADVINCVLPFIEY